MDQFKTIPILFICLLVINCKREPHQDIMLNACELITNDTFSIALPGENEYFPARLWQIKMLSGSEFYVRGLGPSGVDIWDLETKMKTGQIRIDKDGPNAMGEMVSFYYQNEDSLFTLSQSHINLYDGQGQLVRRWWINTSDRSNVKGLDFDRFQIRNNVINTNPIHYRKGQLYATIRKQSSLDPNYKFPIIGYLDLHSEEWVNLDISYPEDFNQFGFGLMDWPNVVYTEDRIIVSFMIGADFWVYDYQGHLIDQFSPKGGYSNLKVEPYSGGYDPDRMMDHLNHNPLFYPVYYFKDAHAYFRIIANAKQEDPHLYFLVLMNEVGQTIHEESLLTTDHYQINGRFCTSNFYYIPYIQTDENRVDLATVDPGCKRGE